jgi:enoyl-CoA hydratase/carnithine racemase
MDALLRAKLPMRVAIEAMTTGRRYGGDEAAAAGIVDAAVAEAEVWAAAFERARPLAGKAGPTLATIKSRMFAEPAAQLAIVESLNVGD